MTSLIDVIFLLLLFFMLSSTFSKFSEVELVGTAIPGTGSRGETVFVKVTAQRITLNTRDVALPEMVQKLKNHLSTGPGQAIVSLSEDVSSQRLMDVLVMLRRVPHLKLSILSPT